MKVVDLNKYKADKRATRIVNAAFLQTLEDITQEINETLAAIREENGNKAFTKALPETFTPQAAFILSELLETHGNNLLQISKRIRPAAALTDEEAAEARAYMKALPARYRKKRTPIVSDNLDLLEKLLEETEERE